MTLSKYLKSLRVFGPVVITRVTIAQSHGLVSDRQFVLMSQPMYYTVTITTQLYMYVVLVSQTNPQKQSLKLTNRDDSSLYQYMKKVPNLIIPTIAQYLYFQLLHLYWNDT